MPRKDAALRYSPLIAAALAAGRTARAATRKSDVVCANRRAKTPIPTVAASIASSPSTPPGEVTSSPSPLAGEEAEGRRGVEDRRLPLRPSERPPLRSVAGPPP